jgi:phospholipase C
MNVRLSATVCAAAALVMSLSALGTGRAAPAPELPPPAGSLRALVAMKVKHVFVIVQENHTFDNYFGVYPGTMGQTVENLGSATARADDCVPDPQAGRCQRPFLITTNRANAAAYVKDAPDIGGGTNSRYGQDFAIDGGKMDNFLKENEGGSPTTPVAPLPADPTATQIEKHNAALGIMVTYDCDTVPYLWYYAKNFALFDHYFQANTADSTPGNIQLFAGQEGQTEVAAGKAPVRSTFSGKGHTNGLPLGNDNNPPPNQLAFITPYTKPAAENSLSVASMPVLLNPAEDAAAVKSGVTGLIPEDITAEANSGRGSSGWAWYEEGSTSAGGAPTGAFSAHHEAPMYFDYVNNADSAFGSAATLKDNTYAGPGLLTDIKTGALPSSGVFWIKGASTATTWPFHPADPALANVYRGTDDHPGRGGSDHQVGEAFVATTINAIANSPYWKDSVIIVTWDDSGGEYDHLPPTEYGAPCPNDIGGIFAGTPCGDGVRLPFLVISPFAKNGAVVHDQSDAGSVSKFIELAFGLPSFASLPDELPGVTAGLAPSDGNAAIGDLTGALDAAKLSGSPNPASLATIPAPSVPPAMSCSSLALRPLPSPASVPAGFLTQGAYMSSSAAPSVARMPLPNDDGD